MTKGLLNIYIQRRKINDYQETQNGCRKVQREHIAMPKNPRVAQNFHKDAKQHKGQSNHEAVHNNYKMITVIVSL